MSTYIFDFDGTLADTLPALLAIANDLAPEFGLDPMDEAEFQRWRGLTTQEILQEGRVSLWKLPRLIRRVRREQHRIMPEMEMVPGMRAALLQLKARGESLGLATSNGSENIRMFLGNNNLENIFDFTKCDISLFGKARVLRRLIQQQGIDPAAAFYVGDEVRDMQAAQQVGLRSVGVSWGFNTAEALRSVRADFVLTDPTSLLYLPVPLTGEPLAGDSEPDCSEFPGPEQQSSPLVLSRAVVALVAFWKTARYPAPLPPCPAPAVDQA